MPEPDLNLMLTYGSSPFGGDETLGTGMHARNRVVVKVFERKPDGSNGNPFKQMPLFEQDPGSWMHPGSRESVYDLVNRAVTELERVTG